jgi:hypothetical protein
MKVFEFDATVTVRKRVWVSGPETAALAHDLLKAAIMGGMGFGPFARRNDQGHPIEVILSNDVELEEVA